MTQKDRWAFQADAVKSIVKDFTEEPNGRFLLVVPTGGGKTRTAVLAIHGLFNEGVLNSATDRVLWVAHRQELLLQAQKSFDDYEQAENIESKKPFVEFAMLGSAADHLANHPEFRFVVIDEAHHGAAPSYQPIFDNSSLGILGLTATPTRHDGQPLQFSRESYSIGFPDLVDLGVLLRPQIIRVDGGRYLINNVDEDDALAVLNNDERNQRILGALWTHKEKLRKVVIYVGTVQHAEDLYRLLKASDLRLAYDSVAFITGADRKRFLCTSSIELSEERPAFFAAQKTTDRSILVNVDVLTEGYDDPGINAVVMARPTRSKLVYMQAAGRAIRLNPEEPDKSSFILEVVDDLPNVRYRIDNRWLYSDISDALEPAVIDVRYGQPSELESSIERIFDQYSVRPADRTLPPLAEHDRVTMLLFKVYARQGKYFHLPVVIHSANRSNASGFFNFLAERMGRFRGANPEKIFAGLKSHMQPLGYLQTAELRRLAFQTMENAWIVSQGDASDPAEASLVAAKPWITFVSFRLRRDDYSLSEDLDGFIADMVNRDEIRETLLTESFTDGYYLTKLPLPLSGCTGAVLPPDEFTSIQTTVDTLRLHKSASDPSAQWRAATEILGNVTLPVENRFHQGLTSIVREDLDYYRKLKR
jgi:superfamily II DNA or RNA helicase